MTVIALLFVGGLFLTIGDIIFKSWIVDERGYWSVVYVGGMLMYVVGLVFLVESFKKEHMAIATIIFTLVNVITLALVSWFWFGENLSPTQMVGIVLACIALALIEFGTVEA